jgi:hypothetical protein
MAEQIKSPRPQSHASTLREDAVRRLSRSPHPYHKQNSEIPYAFERFSLAESLSRSSSVADITADGKRESPTSGSDQYRESTNSDSGTEADDEHFLKGLPAPRLRPAKGLRGADGSISGTSTPISPQVIGDEVLYGRLGYAIKKALSPEDLTEKEVRKAVETFRRNRRIEIVRRVTEGGILAFIGIILYLNPEVRRIISIFRTGKHQIKIFCTKLTNRTRIILPRPHHIISHGLISATVIMAHKSTTSLEATNSFGNPVFFRSGSSPLPTYNHYIRLTHTIHPQPRWVLA